MLWLQKEKKREEKSGLLHSVIHSACTACKLYRGHEAEVVRKGRLHYFDMSTTTLYVAS